MARRVPWLGGLVVVVFLIMVMVAVPVRGRFVVEKSSVRVLAPEHIRGHHDAAIGNFGVPKYGATLTGVVLYPDRKATGCAEFDTKFKSKSRRPVILLLDRGEVVMAGSVATGGSGGVGAGDHRRSRNYIGPLQFTRGGGRPPRPYGRGRGRDRVQSGRGKGDSDIRRPHGRDASGQGIGGHHAPQIGNVILAAGKERGDNSETHAMKHKGTHSTSEPVSKKKKKFVLCCEICEEEHFTPQCPLLHGPKPTATFCGLAGEGLGFFHIPYTSPAKAPRRVSATAKITIVEGNVQPDLVKKELARAIPVKWDWVVREYGNNTYIVPFPCHVELQRMTSMKRLRTDNNEGVMLFEEWDNEIKPKQRLQKVWVNVYGVPYEIRSFLPLWAVGSILGATQRVDMRSMKKTGVVRLLVAVLDAHSIPDDADIVVDDCLYEIFFKVEKWSQISMRIRMSLMRMMI